MGVVDEFMRQKGMQQRLDRGIGRRGIEQVGALHAHHVFVGKLRRVPEASAAARAAPRAGPAGSIVPMSQPLPLTQSTSTSSPARSGMRVLTDVLPPPCSTSAGSPPRSASYRHAAPGPAGRRTRRSDRPQPWRRVRPSGFASSRILVAAEQSLRPPATAFGLGGVRFGGCCYNRCRDRRCRRRRYRAAVAAEDRSGLPNSGTPARRLRCRSSNGRCRLGSR